MKQRRILLIIGGGIAAYKCLELIRRLRDEGASVRAVMTKAATEFITPLSVGALSNGPVLTSLFDLNAEQEIGHIRLSREADLIIVAPATADLLAKMAGGHADDLASTVLMATDKPVLVAPAMNPRMWMHAATRRNVTQLLNDGIHFIGPNVGEMAESNEAGSGRLAEVPEIIAAASRLLNADNAPGALGAPLAGKHVLVTSGPTHEPIDPVRYIANRSSGKQGHAIARAAAALGANVTLVTGPVALADPAGINVVHIETAQEMAQAVASALPADVAIFAAAVADWRNAAPKDAKIKKSSGGKPQLELTENPDILAGVGNRTEGRPALVIGFAAETENVVAEATRKRQTKGADWIVANDVSPARGVFGGDGNTVHLVTAHSVEDWPTLSKDEVAARLMAHIAEHFNSKASVAE
ncbi:bifunctional phosphopantothenoylcysteine decarboxylase/phosphopantothenate--cysteine ligase CoaBC [Hyphomicrobium sp. D-2]|uniref:bifunctional phosphopantothenoylcysteine decarboxylase/phosphopantothenate--cysteine ligase CoaBC n=1 Tax=Hyphomicrobium sp. D-2 TaxID=3041621 RepID=UPI00245488C6|nr:bifunctional phosphopantothenoylcysteine decarboxylase/phosphopantothenate--cysteine ligase CoaBC [Hyphomicrobium sp. D-2]MDH4983087.1 bifunctional phosphopantothenoylcysteine decarboxylase/phosphopantothenate--cysteine ligase CoaBC [Hyphomicrobium sp. D-2]